MSNEDPELYNARGAENTIQYTTTGADEFRESEKYSTPELHTFQYTNLSTETF